MTTTHHVAAGRNREANLITGVLAVSCGLACAGSVIPGLDDVVGTILVALAALTLLALVTRALSRRVRERREDAADALAAARWRAAHALHLLTATDRAHLGAPAPLRGAPRPAVGLGRQAVA